VSYDVIGIGTSPLILMRAVSLAALGKRVVLCDRSQVPGGAWVAGNLVGFSNVENGVHLLENRPILLNALARGLGIAVESDPCFALVGGYRLGMAISRVLIQGGFGFKALTRGEFDKAARSFRSAKRSAQNLNSCFHYPRGGASRVTEELCSRFLSYGGEILFGVEVLRIDVSDTKALCLTTLGKFTADKVLIGSRAFAPITIEGKVQDLRLERSPCQTAVLRIDGKVSFQDTYVEVLGDSHLKRARDVSRFVSPRIHPGERILCVQYRNAFPGDNKKLGDYILSQLLRSGLISREANVLEVCRNEIEIKTIPNRVLIRQWGYSGAANY
jgi:glycine/D-amino acid oxidase-like deaminating enzyme